MSLNHLSRIDFAIIGLGVALCGSSVVMLSSLKPSSSSFRGREEAGQIAQADREVRRRPPETLLWNNVEEQEKVFFGDSVFTGDQASASITLLGGNVVKIAPDSLIVIEKENSQSLLNLHAGDALIELNSAQTVSLKAGDDIMEVGGGASPSSLKVSRDSTGSVRLASLTGEVRVKKENLNDVLGENEEIQFHGKNPPAKRQIELKLLTPKEGSTVWLKPEDKQKFAWSDSKAQDNYHFILKSRGAKGTVLRTEDLNEKSLEASLTEDAWLTWQISRKSDGQVAEGSFYSGQVAPPKPIFPPNGYRVPSLKEPFRFSWKENPNVDGYLLQVADQPNFKNVLVNKRTKMDFADFSAEVTKDVYWRVCYEAQNPLSGLCSTRRVLYLGDPPPAPAPVPVEPARVPTSEPPVVQEAVAKEEAKPVEEPEPLPSRPTLRDQSFTVGWDKDGKLIEEPKITWSKADNSDKYTFEIAKDREFKQIVFKSEQPKPRANWRDVQPGHHFMRVTASNGEGKSGPTSRAATLKINVESPKIVSEELREDIVQVRGDLEKATPVQIEWTKLPIDGRYQLQVVDGSQPDKINELVSDQPTTTVSVSPGRPVKVRVRMVDKSGQPLSAYSPDSTIKVLKRLKLEAPTMTAPAQGAKVVTFGNSKTPILFMWKAVPNASNYELQFSDNEQFSEILASNELRATNYAWRDFPRREKIFWRVRAKFKSHASPWAGPNFIQMDEVRK